jgi:class 3 adenylate cyclase
MALRVERKLAAILAADVVGYSRLMEADEEGTHARLKALRKELIEPRIADHAGQIVKLTGDGALVEFPSVVEAVLAAVDIQRAVTEHQAGVPEAERIAFRIGVNLGDVIHDEKDIYGDGVNVAARLEALAVPGGICVSRTVHNHVKNKLDLEFVPMGEHKVKNIAEPVEVWRVALDGSTSKPRQRRVASRRPRSPRASWRCSPWAAPAHGGGTVPGPRSRRRCRCPISPRSPFSPSRTSAVTLPKSALRTGSRKTSSPICRGFAICSSSPATLPPFTRIRRSTSVRSGATSASATCSKAACRPRPSACGSRLS